MLEIFNENDYGFTDSILCEIKLDDNNIRDYLVIVDYYLGRNENSLLTFRLKNVMELSLNLNKSKETELISILTLAHISKTKKGELVELKILSAMTFSPEHQNNEPLIRCLCEEVYIEKQQK